MYRPEDAFDPVPAEPCAPVQVRLEETTCDRRDCREHNGEHNRAHKTEPRPRFGEHATLEQRTFAYTESSEPADRDRERTAERQCDEREHRQRGTAGAVLEDAGGRGRSDRVRNAAGEERSRPQRRPSEETLMARLVIAPPA